MANFRAQLRAGCKTVLDTVQAANPTILHHVYDHTPPVPRTPCAWVDKEVAETFQHTSGVRLRRAEANVVVLNRIINNDQMTDEQDVLEGLLLEAFTAAPRAASAQSLIEPTAVVDREFTFDGVAYAGFVMTISGLNKEGRL